MIRHAAAGAVGALPVAMVETPFRAALMAGPGSSNRPATTGRPARRRAVGVAAVTRRADGEGTAAVTTGSLSEGLVHGVGARGAVSDWTTSVNRGTTAAIGSICRSSRRSRGSRWAAPGPHPTSESAPTLPERRAGRQRRGRGRRRSPRAKNAPSGSLENREERGFPQRPQPRSSSSSRSTRRGRCPRPAHRRASRIRQVSMVVDIGQFYAATRTATGLRVRAHLVKKVYKTGLKVTDAPDGTATHHQRQRPAQMELHHRARVAKIGIYSCAGP